MDVPGRGGEGAPSSVSKPPQSHSLPCWTGTEAYVGSGAGPPSPWGHWPPARMVTTPHEGRWLAGSLGRDTSSYLIPIRTVQTLAIRPAINPQSCGVKSSADDKGLSFPPGWPPGGWGSRRGQQGVAVNVPGVRLHVGKGGSPSPVHPLRRQLQGTGEGRTT